MSHLFALFISWWWEVRWGGGRLRLLAGFMLAAPLAGQRLSAVVLFPFVSCPCDARSERPLFFFVIVVVIRLAQGGVINGYAALLGRSFYDITEE